MNGPKSPNQWNTKILENCQKPVLKYYLLGLKVSKKKLFKDNIHALHEEYKFAMLLKKKKSAVLFCKMAKLKIYRKQQL